jgi:hypothetical protein
MVFSILFLFLSTNGTNIAISAITAGLVTVIKDVYDSFKKYDFWIKRGIQNEMSQATVLYDLNRNGGIYLEHEVLEDYLINIFQSAIDDGGLYVLASPPNTGKTVYVQETLKKFKPSFGKSKYVKVVRFDSEVVNMTNLKKKLNIPDVGSLTDFLPNGSLIIIDQFDIEELDSDMKVFFTALATTSFNLKTFGVVVSVSSAQVFSEILKCNGGQKIFPVCNPDLFQFDENKMRLYILEKNKKNKKLDEHEIESIIEKCKNQKSIGILRNMVAGKKPYVGEINWQNFSIVYESFFNGNLFNKNCIDHCNNISEVN